MLKDQHQQGQHEKPVDSGRDSMGKLNPGMGAFCGGDDLTIAVGPMDPQPAPAPVARTNAPQRITTMLYQRVTQGVDVCGFGMWPSSGILSSSIEMCPNIT